MGFSLGSFSIVEEGRVKFIKIIGPEATWPANLPLEGPGVTVKAAKTGKTQLITDTRLEIDYVGPGMTSTERIYLSELAVPIKIGEEVAAVINFESEKTNAFTDHDRKLIELFAEHVASAMGRLRYQTDLEKLVAEKTSELKDANLKLQNYNTELKKLNEMKTQFISAATHELKTPLTSIIGYLELFNKARQKNLSPKEEELLIVVERNVNRLQQLTEDLLDLHRIESGRIDLNKEPTDIEELVQQSMTELQPLLNNKKQRIKLTSTIARKVVKADRLRINQVLINLIGNASKFSPENTDIDINIEDKEGAVKISIRDRGIGINKEGISKLFNPFPMIPKQIHYPGTGLGLSICKGIVELHDGKIWGESEGEEKGSTFIFTIPRRSVRKTQKTEVGADPTSTLP